MRAQESTAPQLLSCWQPPALAHSLPVAAQAPQAPVQGCATRFAAVLKIQTNSSLNVPLAGTSPQEGPQGEDFQLQVRLGTGSPELELRSWQLQLAPSIQAEPQRTTGD